MRTQTVKILNLKIATKAARARIREKARASLSEEELEQLRQSAGTTMALLAKIKIE